MPGKNFYIGCGAGLAAGGLQGYGLREFVDKKYRIDALGDFGQPSVLAGLAGASLHLDSDLQVSWEKARCEASLRQASQPPMA